MGSEREKWGSLAMCDRRRGVGGVARVSLQKLGRTDKRGSPEGVRRGTRFEWGTDNGEISGGARNAERHSRRPRAKLVHLTWRAAPLGR